MLIDLEDVHNLDCLITEPTRCTDLSQTLIDVILTNKPEYFEMSGQLDMGMSDHNIVYGLMNKKIKQYPRKVISFRSRKHLDEEKLKKDLEEVPWHVGSIFDSIDDQYYFWNKMVTEIINQHLPIKKMRVRAKDAPYMTSEWKKSIRQKRKFAKIYARERTAENWKLKKKYRNEATRQRCNAIKDYWMQKTEELKDKPRNFSRAFNPFIGKKNEKGEDNLINLTKDDRITDNQREVAEVLASYFTNMGMADNITTEESNNLDKHPSVTVIREQGNGHTNFIFKEFQQQETRNSLQKSDVKKATGCDGISPELMKMTANQLTPSLTTLFNNCIRLKEWPSLWKRGEWRPAFKQGDKLNKKNHRPITILNTINKVL
eukprot:gene1606-1777_t